MRTTGDNKHNSIGVTPPNDLIKVAYYDNLSNNITKCRSLFEVKRSMTTYNVLYVCCTTNVMESQKSENTRLDNSTYNVMVALGREADFLHSTIDTYIADAERENKTKLVEVWNNIKQDKQEHLDMLKNCLENEVEKGELNK